jgi:hypothetical protein
VLTSQNDMHRVERHGAERVATPYSSRCPAVLSRAILMTAGHAARGQRMLDAVRPRLPRPRGPRWVRTGASRNERSAEVVRTGAAGRGSSRQGGNLRRQISGALLAAGTALAVFRSDSHAGGRGDNRQRDVPRRPGDLRRLRRPHGDQQHHRHDGSVQRYRADRRGPEPAHRPGQRQPG